MNRKRGTYKAEVSSRENNFPSEKDVSIPSIYIKTCPTWVNYFDQEVDLLLRIYVDPCVAKSR